MNELMQQEKEEIEEQQQQEQQKGNEHQRQLRSRTGSGSPVERCQTFLMRSQPKRLHRRQRRSASLRIATTQVSIPDLDSANKKHNSGPRKLILSEYAEDTIRYHFHLLLQEKVYPTTARLLSRLHRDFNDFPIRSVSKLWSEMRRLGFTYQRTNKVKVPLDSSSFVAARARYFQTMKQLRDSCAHIYFYDETWVNLGDVKRSIWVLEGHGRIRQHDSKGRRLAVSALISPEGYHLGSVEIFVCSEDHNMDSDQFIKWMTETCIKLCALHGDEAEVAIVLDNAPWHNTLTPESIVPKRSWRKGAIQEWLQDHQIDFGDRCVKAELLEQALANAPTKEYKSDQIAAQFNIQIVRLPYRHCCLNPIKLSWNSLKQYIRDNNVTFKLNDVYNLILEFMGAVDAQLAKSYFNHVKEIEQTFQDPDCFLEEHIVSNLIEEETATETDNNDGDDDDDDDDNNSNDE